MRAFKGFNKDLTCRGYQYEDPADVGVDLTELEDTAVQDELDKICSDNDKDDLFIE